MNMSRSEDWVRLRHMLDAAREAVGFAAGRPRTDLDRDRQLLLALFSDLSLIGEAANHVSDPGRAKLPDIAWGPMIGMRNRLVHEYFDIDTERVWDTVRDDLPTLIDQLETFLRAEGHLD
jgi:uncharacterized protein with HEPN domain